MPSLAVETFMGRTRYIRPVVPIVAVEMLQREAAIADNGVDTTLRATYILHNGAGLEASSAILFVADCGVSLRTSQLPVVR